MKKTVEHYLSLGCDRKTAEYYAGGRKRIVGVSANDDFTLTINFDNGECRLLDMSDCIKNGTVFEHIANIEDFRRVYIDEQNIISWDIDPKVDSNEVWSNKIDLCPDSCYIDSTPITDI